MGSSIQYVLKISEKLLFCYLLTPNTHTYVNVSGGKKCYFFRKFCVLTKRVTPILSFKTIVANSNYY